MKAPTLRIDATAARKFAQLSGDANPIHLDPKAARRTIAGEPVAHGIHALLHALDDTLANRPTSTQFGLTVHFRRPVPLNEPIVVERVDANTLSLVDSSHHQAVGIELRRDQERAEDCWDEPTRFARTSTRPRVRTLDDLADAAGAIKFSPGRPFARIFPRASRALGVDTIRALAAVSQLVGMECPGRDSLLSALDIRIRPHATASGFSWKVVRVHPRFRLVRIAIACGCVHGTVDAFLRPAAVQPPSWQAIAASGVQPAEFAGQRALIVGGSRGLGAAVAMIVAGGGGVPLVTFAAGKEEAAALSRDARRVRRKIEAAPFDVERGSDRVLGRIAKRFRPTHLYYFATPKIFAPRRGTFDRTLFERFSLFYVTAFAETCAAVAQRSSPLRVFYPSTAAVDEQVTQLIEYLAAKSAGEALCGPLEAALPGVTIIVKRLPRIATDQTVSLLQARAGNAIDAMLPIVREMHGAGSPSS